MDEDKEVAAVWGEIWEEGVSSEPAALRLYAGEVSGLLVAELGSGQWGRKKAGAEAVVRLMQVAPDALGDHGKRLVTALLAELGVGRLWEGKEALLAALAAAVGADVRMVAGQEAVVVAALMAAAGRKKVSYRTAALAALEACLRGLPGDHWADVAPPLLAAVRSHCEAGAATGGSGGADGTAAPAVAATATAAAGGGGGDASNPSAAEVEAEKPLPLTESLNCLAAAIARVGMVGSGGSATAAAAAGAVGSGGAGAEMEAAAAAVLAAAGGGEGLAAALRLVLGAQLPWQPKLAAAGAATALAQRCTAAGVPPAAAAELLGPLAPGLLQSAQDHKIQQFRLAALSALTAIAQAAAPPPPPAAPTASAAASTAAAPAGAVAVAVVGWSAADRWVLLPALVSGLVALTEVDKSAAVGAAAAGVRAALEPWVSVAADGDGAAGDGGAGGDGGSAAGVAAAGAAMDTSA